MVVSVQTTLRCLSPDAKASCGQSSGGESSVAFMHASTQSVIAVSTLSRSWSDGPGWPVSA